VEYGVAHLEIFGTASTDIFNPERDGVDFMVTYRPIPAKAPGTGAPRIW